MSKRVTMSDIAREAGVSRTTVSFVINGRRDMAVADETRAAVLETAKRLGFRPSHVARSLVTGRTNIIGVWSGYWSAAYPAMLLKRIERNISENGYALMISNAVVESTRTPHWEFDLSCYLKWSVDGLIALNGRQDIARFLAMYGENRLPIVEMGSVIHFTKDYVFVDLSQAAEAAVRHLVGTGCRKIVRVGSLWDGPAGMRAAAYEKVMKESGLPMRAVLADPLELRSSSRQAAVDLVKNEGCPDAFFCTNDDMAIGIYRAAHELGLKIPEDISIIGCDGVEDTLYLEKQLSTIVQPINEMCDLAFEFMNKRLKQPETGPQRANLTAKLELRDTTR